MGKYTVTEHEDPDPLQMNLAPMIFPWPIR